MEKNIEERTLPTKRKRTKFTVEQIQLLDRFVNNTGFFLKSDYEELAEKLDLPPTVVKNYVQNKRSLQIKQGIRQPIRRRKNKTSNVDVPISHGCSSQEKNCDSSIKDMSDNNQILVEIQVPGVTTINWEVKGECTANFSEKEEQTPLSLESTLVSSSADDINKAIGATITSASHPEEGTKANFEIVPEAVTRTTTPNVSEQRPASKVDAPVSQLATHANSSQEKVCDYSIEGMSDKASCKSENALNRVELQVPGVTMESHCSESRPAEVIKANCEILPKAVALTTLPNTIEDTSWRGVLLDHTYAKRANDVSGNSCIPSNDYYQEQLLHFEEELGRLHAERALDSNSNGCDLSLSAEDTERLLDDIDSFISSESGHHEPTPVNNYNGMSGNTTAFHGGETGYLPYDPMAGNCHTATPYNPIAGNYHTVTPYNPMAGSYQTATPYNPMAGNYHTATPYNAMAGNYHTATPYNAMAGNLNPPNHAVSSYNSMTGNFQASNNFSSHSTFPWQQQ